MRLRFASWLLACSLSMAPALAAPPPPPPAAAPTLATVAVAGVQPGPGLWKLSRNGHVMWILGLVSPLPEQMQWQSKPVEAAIARAQEVLEPPAVHLQLHTGWFGRLLLLPALIGARDNPDGRRLQQAVPAAAYARWQQLKPQYLGDERKVEHWRPVFAAYELYSKAIKKSGLSHSGGVVSAVRSLADQHHVPRVSTRLTVTIEQPRHALKTFKRSPLDDVACFQTTLDNLGTDMQSLTRRANAWATGDLGQLRRLYRNAESVTCLDAVTDAGFMRQLGLGDIPAREQAHWLALAEAALARDQTSFAMLPMEALLGSHNYLSALQAQGYRVEAPDAGESAAPASSTSSGD